MKRKLLCLLLFMLLVTTEAQAAEKPNAAVDTSRSCTLTLQYAASGQTVHSLRRVRGIRHLYARRERSGGVGCPA